MMWLKGFIVGLLTLILVLFVWTSSTVDLLIHYARYENVVEKARKLTAETHDTIYFRGDWDFDVSGMPSRSNICAKRLEDGTLFVRILVQDRHRLGKSGLVYTEKDNASSENVERDLDTYGCGEWTSKGSIWGRWWAIENNLG